jgi:hypothetical protein
VRDVSLEGEVEGFNPDEDENKTEAAAAAAKDALTLVSAFYDIGRASWNILQRSVDVYIEVFEHYRHLPYPIILFMDDRYLDKIPAWPQLTIIPINRQWLEREIWAWQQLERERSIMETESFKEIVRYRTLIPRSDSEYINPKPGLVPEAYIPEYTVINHAKIDFVGHAVQNGLVTTQWVAWSDFGYFCCTENLDIPIRPINFQHFKADKVTYGLLNKLNDQDFDVKNTLTFAPIRIAGAFFIATPDIMLVYQALYHSQVQEFQNMGIADDDQHLVLRCIYASSNLFDLRLMTLSHIHFHTFASKSGGKKYAVELSISKTTATTILSSNTAYVPVSLNRSIPVGCKSNLLRVAVVSLATPAVSTFYQYTAGMNAIYASRHGYSYTLETCVPDTEAPHMWSPDEQHR